jgi:hypothetical protein
MKIIEASQPKTEAVTTKISRLAEDWFVVFEMAGKRYRLTITSGFLFDGASIPRLFWTILGLAPHGVMDGPALPHDCGYEVQGVFTLHINGELNPAPLSGGALAYLEVYAPSGAVWMLTSRAMSKPELDQLLRLLCRHFAIVKRSRLVWLGVKLGGGFAWRSDDKSRKFKLLEAQTR